jgi:UDP-N-acetylmuramoyl-tripeptide--D-alanyl-D-alanine ligase
MGEVGDQGPQFHDEAGQHARAMGIENLFTLGEQAQRASCAFGPGRHFSDMDALVTSVLAELPHSGSVLVKGSRFMKMEQVVQAIAALAADQISPHKKAPHAA